MVLKRRKHKIRKKWNYGNLLTQLSVASAIGEVIWESIAMLALLENNFIPHSKFIEIY